MILRLATDGGLIDLDGRKHETVVAIGESHSDPMTQVPGGFLTDAEVALQLATGHPLQVREHQMHSADPDPTTQQQAMHHRVRFYPKVTSTLMEPMRLGPTILPFGDLCLVVKRTPDAIRLATCNEPFLCGFFIGRDSLKKLPER